MRTSIDNVGMPENLSNSEIFAAFRRDNALIRNLNGSKLGTAQIREFIKDGTIEFHVGSINDPNPKVCDKAEEIAQKMLLQTHYASSTIRTIAAGTVCTGNKVDKGGYRIFCWVMNAQDDPRFRVVKFSQCRMVLSKEEVVCVTTRPQECEQTNPKPSEIPAMTVLAKHTKFEKQVRMQCLGSWKWPFKESIHFGGQWYSAYSSVGVTTQTREVDQAYIGLWRGWRACS